MVVKLLWPMIEADDLLAVLGPKHRDIFATLEQLVGKKMAVLMMILCLRRDHRDEDVSRFSLRLKEVFPDEVLERLHVLWLLVEADDYMAIASSPKKAFETIKDMIGDHAAVMLVTLKVRSHHRMKTDDDLEEELKVFIPEEYLKHFKVESSGLLQAI